MAGGACVWAEREADAGGRPAYLSDAADRLAPLCHAIATTLVHALATRRYTVTGDPRALGPTDL
ncbi:hypothetical protein [Streptomyces sp. enrichment culture]|uniref:hypothetical protein n=1 Tax=Streptomyces sp. enrichment culture TaxID=1795815 RepID=UPI003F543E43